MLLEKPPCLSLADMDAIAEAEARSSGSVYAVFQHRHGSGARRAHRLLSAGALGVPQLALCETLWFRPDSYFDPEWRGTWSREGGGPTLGHGIHQIDLLLHLLGPWTSLTAPPRMSDRSSSRTCPLPSFASGRVHRLSGQLTAVAARAQPASASTPPRARSRSTTSMATRTRLELDRCTWSGAGRQLGSRTSVAQRQRDTEPSAPTATDPGATRQARTYPAVTLPRSAGWSRSSWPAGSMRPRSPALARPWSS